MPRRTTHRRRRANGRRRNIRQRGRVRTMRTRIPRGIGRMTVPSTRRLTYMLSSNETLPTNWALGTDANEYWITATQVFSLSMLPNYTDYTNSFKEYKINCVVMTITPIFDTSYQTAHDNGTTYRPPYGASILCKRKMNQLGTQIPTTFNNAAWNEIAATKTTILYNGKPRSFKVFPKLLNRLDDSLSSLGHSAWLTTSQPEVPHYGLDLGFSWVDYLMAFGKTSDAAMPIRFRLDFKFYLQLKGWS